MILIMKKKYLIILLLSIPYLFNNSFAYSLTTDVKENFNINDKGDYSITKHVLGPKVGICMAGFSNYGFQGFSFKPQFGIMGLYRITRSLGIQVEICYTHMGTRDTPLPIPVAVKLSKRGTEAEKEISDDENISKDMDEIADKAVKTLGHKLVFKKEQNIEIEYITIPINLCLIFKSHETSFITNYFLFGLQFGFLINAKAKRYSSPSMLVSNRDKETIYWNWTKATKSEEIELKNKINPFDFGFSFGYMFETMMGFLFGIKYYDGMIKTFEKDENEWIRQRKNFAIEFFICYNFASLF